MRKGILFFGFSVLVAAASAVACGDDDDGVAPGVDGGGTSSGGDGSTTPDSARADTGTPDGSSSGSAAITQLAQSRFENATNAYGLVFASDGFLYASGGSHVRLPADLNGQQELAVWRFNATTGALDTTWGTNGVVTLRLPASAVSYDIVELSAGSFVVQAVAGGQIYLVKLTKNGNTGTWGTPKRVEFAWGPGETTGWPTFDDGGPRPAPAYQGWGIAVDRSEAANLKLVVTASGAPAKANGGTQRTDNDRWITRVDANDFNVDPSFNGGAPLSIDADGKNLGDNARRAVVLSDGTIVASGYTNFGTGLGNHVVLIRVTKAGALDTTFGFGASAGQVGQTKVNPFAPNGAAEAYSVGVQSNGRYVTTGYGNSNFDVPTRPQGPDMIALGIKADGLDTAFGRQGSFAIQSEATVDAGDGGAQYEERGRDLVVLPDDRTVHAGAFGGKMAIFVLTKEGALDTSVGASGRFELPISANAFRVVASADGKTLAVTSASVNETSDAGILDAGTLPVSNLVLLKVGN